MIGRLPQLSLCSALLSSPLLFSSLLFFSLLFSSLLFASSPLSPRTPENPHRQTTQCLPVIRATHPPTPTYTQQFKRPTRPHPTSAPPPSAQSIATPPPPQPPRSSTKPRSPPHPPPRPPPPHLAGLGFPRFPDPMVPSGSLRAPGPHVPSPPPPPRPSHPSRFVFLLGWCVWLWGQEASCFKL